MTVRKRALENTVGKGKNAGDQHFLIFSQCVLLYHREKFNLSSANAFNLVTSKILLFGKGFKESYRCFIVL